jgi:hypothetical protein
VQTSWTPYQIFRNEAMRTLKLWNFLVVLIICLIAGFFGFDKYMRHCRRNAAFRTMYAIQTAIVSEIQKENHGLWEVSIPGDGHWYILRSTTYDSLVTKLSKHHDLEMPKDWIASRSLLDPWGNRFRIMFYHNPYKTWGISIISNGPDCVEQTPDDLGGSATYPYPGVDIYDPNLKSPDFVPGFDRYRVVE